MATKLMEFQLGQVVATPGALEALEKNNVNALEYLSRHASCDWGDLDLKDQESNTEALASGARLMSAYTLPNDEKIWIITEAADETGKRVATTLLRVDEY